jgi:hypothetical protein
VLQKIIEIRERFPNGLPRISVNIGCVVKKLYPPIDSLLGLIAVENWLRLHPNPVGLPTELIRFVVNLYGRKYLWIIIKIFLPAILLIILWES